MLPPRNYSADVEDTESFAAELHAIIDSDEDVRRSFDGHQTGSDSNDSGSDLDTTILSVPRPDAPMHEVRKESIPSLHYGLILMKRFISRHSKMRTRS